MLFSKASLAVATGLVSLGLVAAQDVPKFQYGTPSANAPGVKGANKNGPTNPRAPQLNTPINQTSEARLVSVNSVTDWCTFSSPDGKLIADTESYTVAYCTQARNNARVIPDGTLTGVHFVKTPLYVQVMAVGDFTKIGIQKGDEGGELDPHGATNMGNPIGGNVTSNVSGEDVFYEEWMNYISDSQVCIRVCIAGSDAAPTPLECQHTLDEMGCAWVMPGDYSDGTFDSCDADAAYPPGLYPQGNGKTSTFQQYFSSVFTAPNGDQQTYINASPDQTTPQTPYSTPASSNCQQVSTISNGLNVPNAGAASPTGSASNGMTTATTGKSSSSGSKSSSSNSTSNSGGNSGSSGASPMFAQTFALGSLAAALIGGAIFLN